MSEQQTISVNGIQLNYVTYGAPELPTIILLHALGEESSDWHHIAGKLATTHRIYALDSRGHGKSEWPGEYSLELMRDDVLAFAVALEIEQATLVGHSLGGTIAWLVAQRQPAWVSHLVIEDSPMLREGWAREVPPHPGGELPLDYLLVQGVYAELNDPDPAWWNDLKSIKVPTLLFDGGPESNYQDLITEIAGMLPHCRHISVAAGHHIHRNRPDDFLAALRAFLSE